MELGDLFLPTWIFVLVCAGEPHKLGRNAPAGTNDVDKGAVDIELKVIGARCGHEVLDAH